MSEDFMFFPSAACVTLLHLFVAISLCTSLPRRHNSHDFLTLCLHTIFTSLCLWGYLLLLFKDSWEHMYTHTVPCKLCWGLWWAVGVRPADSGVTQAYLAGKCHGHNQVISSKQLMCLPQMCLIPQLGYEHFYWLHSLLILYDVSQVLALYWLAY